MTMTPDPRPQYGEPIHWRFALTLPLHLLIIALMVSLRVIAVVVDGFAHGLLWFARGLTRDGNALLRWAHRAPNPEPRQDTP